MHKGLTKDEYVSLFVEHGYALVPLNGKIPAKKDWRNLKWDPFVEPDDFAQQNYGVVIAGAEYPICVVDIDPRNFPRDRETGELLQDSHKKLFDLIGVSAIDTFTVRTGGRVPGYHIYFRLQEYQRGARIRKKIAGYEGIDFLTANSQVVGPGSIHPETGNHYIAVHGRLDKLAPFPEEFFEITSVSTKVDTDSSLDFELTDYVDNPELRGQYANFLRYAQPAIEGNSGDVTTVKTAMYGRDLGLPPDVTFELMWDIYNPRCVPQWTDTRMREKVNNAYTYARGKLGSLNPELEQGELLRNFHVVDKHDDAEADRLSKVRWNVDYNKKKIPETNQYPIKPNDLVNTTNYFRKEEYRSFKNPLCNIVRYNRLRHCVEFNFHAPWHDKKRPVPTEWTDMDTTQCRYYLEQYEHYKTSGQCVFDAVTVVSADFAYNPLHSYLDALTWDGKERLDDMLYEVFGVPRSTYSRAVSSKLLIAAVARAYEPGCKVDNVLILEGDQGIRKSTFVSALGGEFYTDMHLDPHAKDTFEILRGAWFVELAEMGFLKRSQVESLKAFFSKGIDRYRASYGRLAQDYPRTCIFIGTINPSDMGTYLTDRTGNRRFWPVKCMKHGDIDWVIEHRDQLFAEAKARYLAGEAWYLTTEDEITSARRATADRMVKDPWEAPIIQHVNTIDPGEGVVVEEIAENIIGIDRSRIKSSDLERISYILQNRLSLSPETKLTRYGVITIYRPLQSDGVGDWLSELE